MNIEFKEEGKVRILADVPPYIKSMLNEIKKAEGITAKEVIANLIKQKYEQIHQERAE